MIVRDDRTPEQIETHPILIVGTDRFLSGWGKARGGMSYAAWACTPEDERSVLEWVERRGDLKRVRVVCGAYRPSGSGDCHIYVVQPGHPAIN